MDYMKKFQFWLDNDYFDEKTKEELLAIRNNASEIEDRFYKDLEFGTGGLRGVIGAGTNRMNVYTVRKASQGLANYILKKGGTGQSGCHCIRLPKNVSELQIPQHSAWQQAASRHMYSSPFVPLPSFPLPYASFTASPVSW